MMHLMTGYLVKHSFLFDTCSSSANKCLLKVGHYSAQLEQYQKAIEIYEQVTAATSMISTLLIKTTWQTIESISFSLMLFTYLYFTFNFQFFFFLHYIC